MMSNEESYKHLVRTIENGPQEQDRWQWYYTIGGMASMASIVGLITTDQFIELVGKASQTVANLHCQKEG